MKAAVYDRYGSLDVVRWDDVDSPRAGAREVGVRVEAAALNPKDIMLRKGKYRLLSGSTFPKQLGLDYVGHVIELGARAPRELAGARVFGFFSGFRARVGSICERTVVRADQLARIGGEVNVAAAAATPLAGSTALQAFRDDAKLRAGERVLIVGASGGVGTFAVQVAKLLGAHVSASASARNAELVRALGADEVLDHAGSSPLGRGPYDVVLDCFGKLRAPMLASVLGRRGRFVSLVPSPGFFRDLLFGALAGRRVRLTNVQPRGGDLAVLARWLEEGRLRPVVERTYEPAQLADAMRHLETRHARGKLVIGLT